MGFFPERNGNARKIISRVSEKRSIGFNAFYTFFIVSWLSFWWPNLFRIYMQGFPGVFCYIYITGKNYGPSIFKTLIITDLWKLAVWIFACTVSCNGSIFLDWITVWGLGTATDLTCVTLSEIFDHLIHVQYWSLLNWRNFRFRCGSVAVAVNWLFVFISSFCDV